MNGMNSLAINFDDSEREGERERERGVSKVTGDRKSRETLNVVRMCAY